MTKPITFEGLKVRPSYDELINLLDKPVVDKYPDRKASTLRNSHWLSQLDGDSFRAMDELHTNMLKEQEQEAILKGYASSHNVSLGSLRAQHLAPSSHNSPRAAAMPPPTASPTQHFYLTPPQSPRQQPATPQPTPPFVFPDIQQHYQSIPKRVKQSITRKITIPKVKKVNNKFKDMHDDKLDDKIEEEQDMHVDDAEMRERNAQAKLAALLKEMDQMILDQTGVKREADEEASSSTRPKAKANTKKTADKRDADASPPKAKAKARTSKPDETARALDYDKEAQPKTKPKSPTKKAPEEDHPKAKPTPKPEAKKEEKIPVKKTIPPKKDVPKANVVHGTKIEKLSFDEWYKKGRGFLVDQLDLRKIKP